MARTQDGSRVRTALWVVASAVCYYLSTQIAWVLCFPDSKVSLFFPPHAVLVSILLLVPTRYWWAFTLAAAGSHFLATQQAHWPFFYALECEAFDALQNVLTAAGLRVFITSPLKSLTLRDAIVFVLLAVVLIPFGTAFWGAAFTVSNNFGTHYWVEWRNLGVSNAVTAIVLVPGILLGVQWLSDRRFDVKPARLLEAAILGAAILAVGTFAFNNRPAGPETSPALLYSPIPLLIWAALRFGLGGTSAAMLVITCQAIWGTMHGRGPFLMQSPVDNALSLQLFLLFTATPLMFLAVVIEDERRSRVELHTSQERMTLASDAAQLGMWTWDTASNSIWFTDKLREVLGYSAAERVTYESFLARVHEDDRAAVAHALQQALSEGGHYHSESRMVLPGGRLRWFSLVGRAKASAAGTPAHMLGVAIDVTERHRVEAESRAVSGKLITAQEDERKRIARDLHDDLNQRLALLAIEMHLFGSRSSDTSASARDHLTSMTKQVKDLSAEVHKLSYQLHPARLDQLGLVVAASTFCSEVSQQAGIPIGFEQHDVPRDLAIEVALCLYRVIQEGVQNAVRHNGRAGVQVSLVRAGDEIRLLIADEGKGFDPEHALRNGGLGLVSMRERVRQVHGSLLITSSPGGGARIDARAPLLRSGTSPSPTDRPV